MTWRDLRWPEVTRKWHHLIGSHLEVAVEGEKLAYAVDFTSHKNVARGRRQSRDRKSRDVTSGDRKWRHFTGSHLEVAVEGRKLAYTVYFTSSEAEACSRRQSRDRKRRHVTWGDRKLPGSGVIWRKSPGSDCRRLKTRVYCTFHFLQGCSLQCEAVTWRKWVTWP